MEIHGAPLLALFVLTPSAWCTLWGIWFYPNRLLLFGSNFSLFFFNWCVVFYNVVLVSTSQQSESAICISPLFRIAFPFRSPSEHWVEFQISVLSSVNRLGWSSAKWFWPPWSVGENPDWGQGGRSESCFWGLLCWHGSQAAWWEAPWVSAPLSQPPRISPAGLQ